MKRFSQQDVSESSSHVALSSAQVRKYQDMNCRPSDKHADGTDPLAMHDFLHDFLLVFYSEALIHLQHMTSY